jgi:tetratricopeptide (TPR) repeat protein
MRTGEEDMSKKQKRPPMQRRRKTQPETSQPPTPPDRRALEKTIADMGRILNEQQFESIEEANAFIQNLMASGQPLDRPGSTPVEQAQDLMYQAWDAQGARRIRLARKALKISEDCADAYVLLAEEAAHSVEEAKGLYEQGVAAGERALGPKIFEEDAGHFWGMVQTRPYMRARAGLAGCLYTLGQREEAAEHYLDMMRLNPGDNQGIRYFLANLLLELGDYERLEAFFAEHGNEDTAAMLYPRALAAFQQKGETKAATALLKKAITSNRHVPAFLLGERPMPKRLPDYVTSGGEDEAVHYVADAQSTWGQNHDALVWLRRTLCLDYIASRVRKKR